jgi:hypothetical protein
MNKRIALGAALILAIGSAAAGSTFVNGSGSTDQVAGSQDPLSVAAADVTPEMLAKWQVTAESSDNSLPRLPI